MPNYLFGDSDNGTYTPLLLQNTGSDHGPLIIGLKRYSGSGNAFIFNNDGGIWTDGRIEALGGFWTNKDVFALGNVFARGTMISCDKNTKENFSNINMMEILENLASMPIRSWNYKDDPTNVRHIGPTAQDFHVAFGLNGDDNLHISSVDLQGVALAAIQGLNKKNEELKIENTQLHISLANIEARLSKLESKS